MDRGNTKKKPTLLALVVDGGKKIKWVFVASDRAFPVRRPVAGSHSPNGTGTGPELVQGKTAAQIPFLVQQFLTDSSEMEPLLFGPGMLPNL